MWTTCHWQIKSLEWFYQTCLRRILNVGWQSFTPDTTVLQYANVPSIETYIIQSQMHCAGLLVRMEDDRLLKQLFYRELQWGKRVRHKPKKHFKDVIKNYLKTLAINFKDWERTVTNRLSRLVYDGCRMFEAMWLKHFILRRVLRIWQRSDILDTFLIFRSDHIWSVWVRTCLSQAGLLSHMWSHDDWQPHEKRMCMTESRLSHVSFVQ